MKLSVVVDVGFIDFFHLTSDYTILALFSILSIQTCFEIVHCVIPYAVKCVRVRACKSLWYCESLVSELLMIFCIRRVFINCFSVGNGMIKLCPRLTSLPQRITYNLPRVLFSNKDALLFWNMKFYLQNGCNWISCIVFTEITFIRPDRNRLMTDDQCWCVGVVHLLTVFLDDNKWSCWAGQQCLCRC